MNTTPQTLYKTRFDSLSRHTTEYEQSVAFVTRAILPALAGRALLLDIGAGSGNLTKPLSAHFERTHVVEPHPTYFDDLVAWGASTGRALGGHKGDWLEDPFLGPADLALVSHVLYFVPSARRAAFIDKAYACLRPGGFLAIILVSTTSGISHLYRELLAPEDYAEMPSIERVLVDLHARRYDHLQLTLFDADISLPDRRAMDELIDFVVAGKTSFDSEHAARRRDAYVERYLRKDDGYAINSNIGLITSRKV